VIGIEIAQSEHATAVARLVRDVSRATYQRSGPDVRRWAAGMARVELWQEKIERPGSVVLTASNVDGLVGVVWVACVEPGGAYDTDGYLGGLYVALPGQGIGGSLVRRAERQALLWQRRALLAEALHGGPGHRMLCRMGWRERSHHPGRIVAGAAWAELVRDLEEVRADHSV
jgi:GNAT superfamily N-acetyltransferase